MIFFLEAVFSERNTNSNTQQYLIGIVVRLHVIAKVITLCRDLGSVSLQILCLFSYYWRFFLDLLNFSYFILIKLLWSQLN